MTQQICALRLRAQPAPARWKDACANAECSLHQLSPYIGKVKSSIAAELVEQVPPGKAI